MWLTLLLACGWNHLPNRGAEYGPAPWDPTSAVATADGVYVGLPATGALALVPENGDVTRVDLDGQVALFDGVAGSDRIVALVERTTCDDDEVESDLISDCSDRIVSTDVVLVDGGEATASVSIDGRYNRLAFSDDARFAVAYLDLSDPSLDLRGVIDLTSIVVVDLVDGTTQPVHVGFAADQVRFHTVRDGLVVLSQNQVAEIDLSGVPFEVQTTFNLTLDPDSIVVPRSVDLTPDGRFALISVTGASDLYALDLEERRVNLVELAGTPASVEVCEDLGRTVLTYGGASTVEVLEHEFFGLESYALDEPMNRILDEAGQVVLFSDTGRKDAYRFDPVSGERLEYRLENPPIDMAVAPTGEYAVAFTRPETTSGTGASALYDSRPGMEIIDLFGNDTQPFLLEGTGVGLAFSESGGRLDALVLQEGVDYLYQLDLYSQEAIELELPAPPVGIGALPGGGFFIAHSSPLGALSFLDPVSGSLTTRSGFATLGLHEPPRLSEEP